MSRRKPRRVGKMLRFCVIVVVPLTGLLFRRRWQHLDRVPAEGAAIMAFNHVSYADPFVVARFVWDCARVPRFLAKAGLFDVPFVGWVLRHTGQIPVRRGTRDASHALGDAVAALRRGEVVVIYPEGTVTRDDDFWPMVAKTGIARLWLLCPDTPVVPAGQWGAQDAIDFYRRRFRPLPPKTVRISVGDPVDLVRFRDQPPTTENLRAITDAIMVAVREQVGQVRGQTPPATFAPRPDGPPPADDVTP